MTARAARKTDLSRKPLLITAGLVALAVPILSGIVNAKQSQAESQAQNTPAAALVYDVASIKPNRDADEIVRITYAPDGFTATGVTLQMLIRSAYDVQDYQISGAPKWVNSEKYNVEAKLDPLAAEQLRKLVFDQRKIERNHILQGLLADRFNLGLHRETRELPIYALVIAKNGPKLRESKSNDLEPHITRARRGQITGEGSSMSSLARLLTHALGRAVQDKTGLRDLYDFTLTWSPSQEEFPGSESHDNQQGSDSMHPPEGLGPSIFTAIQEQLGLKLESQKGPVEILVIDHAEKPSEN